MLSPARSISGTAFDSVKGLPLQWGLVEGGLAIYAVVRTGGKQYRLEPQQIIDVEKLPAEAGAEVELSEVLLIADGDRITVGTPLVPGAKVIAEVVEQGKDDKITVFKYKPKVRYRRKRGHRQPYTRLSIREIISGG